MARISQYHQVGLRENPRCSYHTNENVLLRSRRRGLVCLVRLSAETVAR